MQLPPMAAAAVALAAALGCASLAGPAEACGGFFSRASVESARRPSLTYEQTLIVFDAEKEREHFVREVVFADADAPFGFVVPTPSRPEVAKVAESPFTKLRANFPFEEVGEAFGFGGLGGIGHGGGGRGAGVTVLSKEKVGSFTAFVLAATDDGALARWLGENGLVVSKEAEPWLRHYVAHAFHFVAMRYDPPDAAAPRAGAARPRAETIRISFDSPLPFYPYREPDAPAGAARPERLAEVWLVSTALFVPVAARTAEGSTAWVRPFAEGSRFLRPAPNVLAAALGPEAGLLPSGSLSVQRFADQKRGRSGIGDVVFVPWAAAPADAARRARLRALVSTLDPSLPPARRGGGSE